MDNSKIDYPEQTNILFVGLVIPMLFLAYLLSRVRRRARCQLVGPYNRCLENFPTWDPLFMVFNCLRIWGFKLLLSFGFLCHILVDQTILPFLAFIYGIANIVHSYRVLFETLASKLLITRTSEFTPMRHWFQANSPIPLPEKVSNNPHGNHASVRKTAENFLDHMETYTRPMHSVSKSHRTLEAGDRYMYSPRDQAEEPDFSFIPSTHIIKLVDVDYYEDALPRVLSTGQPVVMYTMIPESAGESDDNYRMVFGSNGKVKVRYSGGTEYEHALWDFSDETITTCGGWFSKHVYSVNRKAVAKGRYIVFFTPMATIGVFGLLLNYFFPFFKESKPLSRFNPVQSNGMVRFEVFGKTNAVMIGHVEQPVSVAVPYALEAELRLRHEDKVSIVKQLLASEKIPHSYAYLFRYPPELETPLVNHFKTDPVVTYAPISPLVLEPKPGMRPLFTAILEPPCVPSLSPKTLEMAYEERMIKPNSGQTTLSNFVSQCMDEFVKLYCPEPGILKMASYDDIRESCNNAKQHTRLDNALDSGKSDHEHPVKAFVKREAYPLDCKENQAFLKDPRCIIDFHDDDRLSQMAVYLPMMRYLSELPDSPYSFSKNPREVHDQVKNFLRDRQAVKTTDFSRFDGSVTEALRNLDRRLIGRLFQADQVEEALRIDRTTVLKKVKSHGATSYWSSWQQLSGGYNTSSANSLRNWFFQYLTARRAGFIPKTAFALVGPLGGDDGICHDFADSDFKWAAQQLSVVIKINHIVRGEVVDFLGRWYSPLTWDGMPSSCCDVPRALHKIHLTTQSSLVNDRVVLYQKGLSIMATDSTTPFLSLLAELFLKVGENEQGVNREMGYYLSLWSDFEFEWNSQGEDWILAQLNKTGHLATLLDKFSTLPDDYNSLKTWVLYAPTPPVVVARTMLVNGEIVEPQDTANNQQKKAKPPKPKPSEKPPPKKNDKQEAVSKPKIDRRSTKGRAGKKVATASGKSTPAPKPDKLGGAKPQKK